MSEIDAVVAENLTMKYIAIMFSMNSLKVCKFQKQIFLFSFEPKKEWNYFSNSALASKMSQIKKNEGTLLYELDSI